MKKLSIAVALLSAIAVMLSSVAFVASAADVSGTIEINKKKFQLSHGYIDMVQPEEPVIVLSDKPLPPEQVPFLNADYSVRNKVHAVVFSIIAKDRKISKELALVYTGGDYDSPAVGFHADIVSLDLKQANDTFIEGKIKTAQPVKLTDLTYFFDASFKLSSKAALAKASAPKQVSFSGDDSAPVKAYKGYYLAIMAGDAVGMKKYLVAKNLKEFEAMESKELEMALDIMKMRPEQLKIEKPVITGDEAMFKASGLEGSAVSTGSIMMVLENGKWKVLEDRWQTVSKQRQD